jgi:hypothetical protein
MKRAFAANDDSSLRAAPLQRRHCAGKNVVELARLLWEVGGGHCRGPDALDRTQLARFAKIDAPQ